MNAPAKLAVGDCVTVRTLRSDGEVVEVLSNGRFRVLVGQFSMICAEKDLKLNTQKKIPPRIPQAPYKGPKVAPPKSSIDLHGRTVEEAIRMVEQWLDQVILAEVSQVKIIHGLGSGKIQRAVHEFLRTLRAVRHFKVNERNPGETDVYL